MIQRNFFFSPNNDKRHQVGHFSFPWMEGTEVAIRLVTLARTVCIKKYGMKMIQESLIGDGKKLVFKNEFSTKPVSGPCFTRLSTGMLQQFKSLDSITVSLRHPEGQVIEVLMGRAGGWGYGDGPISRGRFFLTVNETDPTGRGIEPDMIQRDLGLVEHPNFLSKPVWMYDQIPDDHDIFPDGVSTIYVMQSGMRSEGKKVMENLLADDSVQPISRFSAEPSLMLSKSVQMQPKYTGYCQYSRDFMAFVWSGIPMAVEFVPARVGFGRVMLMILHHVGTGHLSAEQAASIVKIPLGEFC